VRPLGLCYFLLVYTDRVTHHHRYQVPPDAITLKSNDRVALAGINETEERTLQPDMIIP
jgi:hypothetical protein